MESANRAGLLSWVVNTGPATAITVDGDGVVEVIGHLPDPAETPERLDQRRVPATMIHFTANPPG